jgi:hypothetical protein
MTIKSYLCSIIIDNLTWVHAPIKYCNHRHHVKGDEHVIVQMLNKYIKS